MDDSGKVGEVTSSSLSNAFSPERRRGVEAKAILDEAIRFLRRIEYDPALTFSAWFL